MVFVKSQEYINSFGKKSKNILDLAGQSDYRFSYNDETGQTDCVVCYGEMEKFIFSASNEAECHNILQNIFTHHATKESHIIYDVNAFMMPEVENETTLEDLLELTTNVMKFHGYDHVADALMNKLDESMVYLDENGNPVPRDEDIDEYVGCAVDEVLREEVQPTPPQSLHVATHNPHNRYLHYA